MAQGSHVPKFGDWDSENIPYTTYFENARKDKGAGMKKINPNDPEENPDAFGFGSMDRESDSYHPENRSSPSRVTLDRKMMHVAKPKEEDSDREGQMHHNPTQKVVLGHIKSRNHRSSYSASSSDKSNSDYSLLRQKNRLTRSSQKKSQEEDSYGFSQVAPPPRLRIGTNSMVEIKTASVPKFGAWDETDPTSGEGFTVIFNKVKEDKQIAATNFPPIPLEPPPGYSKGNSSPKSKRCCCLF